MVIIETKETISPSQLFDLIKKAINENQINSWVCDKYNNLKHIDNQYKDFDIWFKPKIAKHSNHLVLGMQSSIIIEKNLYGIFHGFLVGMLINHFGDYIVNLSPSVKKNDKLEIFSFK